MPVERALVRASSRSRRPIQFFWIAGALLFGACGVPADSAPADIDLELVTVLRRAGVEPLAEAPPPPGKLVELGRLLFFDKLLSGNKDIACSTCHHVTYHSTDLMSLGIGTGGSRKGPSRRLDRGQFLTRNTSDLYNRGLDGITRLFHDGRVSRENGVIVTPAGGAQLPDVPSLLAAQAMFPVMARREMRGRSGDTAVTGEPNELALVPDQDFSGLWSALIDRILAVPEYLDRFREAFPDTDSADFGFQHAAIAIASFEQAAFTLLNSPFDRYLGGDVEALTDSAKRGGLLFYGRLRCGTCHSGVLLTDQRFHNIGIPDIGDGLQPGNPLDIGRAGVTGTAADRFAFLTPSLRNVLLTEPWMHNGAFTSLSDVVRHYVDPVASLVHYDPSQLQPRIVSLVDRDPATIDAILATLDTGVATPPPFQEGDIQLIVAFLKSLTDPRAHNQLSEIPPSVPSGLPVFD